MVHNERVKLLADLKEAATKHGCTIPDKAAMDILNDAGNKQVLKFPTNYTNIHWDEVDKLIQDREDTKKLLY
jgi:hypothetical protein